MKNLLLSIILLTVCTLSTNAQKKVNLFIQLNSTIDWSNNLNFYGVYPPPRSSKKPKVESIDSLINFDEINEVIKKQDYTGMRVLNELSLLGWKLQATATPGEMAKSFDGLRIVFILSKEFVIPE